jgi:hypothetical protein
MITIKVRYDYDKIIIKLDMITINTINLLFKLDIVTIYLTKLLMFF